MQEYFLCVPWILCENRLTQRRNGRGVCPYMRNSCTQKSQKYTEFAHSYFRQKNIRTYFHAKGAELYVLLFLCQNSLHTQKYTEFAHSFFRQKNIRTYFYFHAMGAELYVLLFLCQNSCAQKTTEFCSACLCESLRRLRETLTLRRDSVSSVSSVWDHLTQTTQNYADFAKLCAFAWDIIPR